MALRRGKQLFGEAIPYVLEQVHPLLYLAAEALHQLAHHQRTANLLNVDQIAVITGVLPSASQLQLADGLLHLPDQHVLRNPHLQVPHQQQDELLQGQQQDQELATRGEEEHGE